jgi:hypothetical protein
MSGTKTIDLGEARTSQAAKVFSGRERGKYWRQHFGLDRLDHDDDTQVIVSIPEDILSINLSFFLSLFGESVRLLGKEDFSQKYRFKCDPSLLPLIEQGIEQALKKSSVLALAFA